MRKFNRLFVRGFALGSIGIGAIGCGSSNSTPVYPSNGALNSGATTNDPSTGGALPTMTVPPSAVTLADATYDKVFFAGPTEPGLIYVYDVTATKVICKTSVGPEFAGKQMTMLDLKNATHELDTSHQYRISFLTHHHEMMQSTMPAGAQ